LRWNSRHAEKPQDEVIVVDSAPDWDEEVIERALERSHTIAEWDEEAAADLRRMAHCARAKLQGTAGGVLVREPYDPMRIYARMARIYRWSFEAMEQMHFITFFAFVREASEMHREDEEATLRARRNQGGTTPPGNAEGLFPVAEPYKGETVAI
jgi:hypothetical protein